MSKGRSKALSSYFCPYRALRFFLRATQGVALGYGLLWAFSPHLLNSKVKPVSETPALTRVIEVSLGSAIQRIVEV